jgi:hypothetical protein
MGATYVISDVHGHRDDLVRVLTEAGLLEGETWAGGDAELWMLGDLVDRGPDGIGVVHLMRSLQQQAPGQVHVLLGNHEALMLGYHLFPDSRFGEVWVLNGGHASDQEGLTEDDVAWLRQLPPLALAGDHLLMHTDTVGYLDWGGSVEDVCAAVADTLAGDDVQAHFDLFARLTNRFDFAAADGADAARRVLSAYGASDLVHGHTIIGLLLDKPSPTTEGPLRYAEGLALDIDGGRYDGGPLLLVELD